MTDAVIPVFLGTSRALDDPEKVIRLLFKAPVSDAAKTEIGLIIANAAQRPNP